MSTWGKLLFDLAKSIAGHKAYLATCRREKRKRIVDYFDHISSTLMDAAAAFEREERPWDKYREIGVHLEGFMKVVGNTLPDNDATLRLWHGLARALWHDECLLGGARDRTILDAITIRPEKAVIKNAAWRDNPIRDMDDDKIHMLVNEEIDRIREVAGMFRGYASQLRAIE